MTSVESPWPAALRRAIGAALPGAAPDVLPLARWLEGDACADRVRDGLAPARSLAAALRALGSPVGPAETALLELALLADGLDPAAPPASPVVLGLRRAALVEGGGPCDHAAALLDSTGRTHLALLGRPGCAAAIRTAATALREAAGEVAAPLAEQVDRQALGLQLAGLAALASLPEPAAALLAAIDRAAALGRAALDLRGRCRAAWDVNRAELDRFGELVGDLFEPLLALDAARRAGLGVSRPLAAIGRARARDGGGMRYFRRCPEMPEDADCAAALLVCASTARLGPDALVARARRVLEAALRPDGRIGTWVSLPEDPATLAFDGWAGHECEGVAGRVLRALSLDRAAWPPGTITRLASWLAGCAGPDGGFSSAYYPSRVVATSLVIEGLAAARAAVDPGPDVAARLGAAVTWLGGRQGPAGAIGDTLLETAAAALALAEAGALAPRCAAEAAAALVAGQRNDGAWPAASCYLTASPGGALRPTGSAALSTALALAVLVACRRALTPPTGGSAGSGGA